MKVKWGTLGITVALLVLAGSIFFAGIRVSTTLSSKTKSVQQQVKREAIAFIYAFRSSSIEDRVINPEDLKKGYQFADSFLSKSGAK
ncbi:hypothetical protein J7M02_08125 [Candidatus Aerophobetes bacterium]|nr:hypothetical protein [Candidatus Aerophobetes bacterium]